MVKDRISILLFGDIVALLASFFAMVWIRFTGNVGDAFVHAQARVFIPLFVVWLIVFFIFELYNFRHINPNPRTVGRLGLALATSALVSVIFFYLFPKDGITPKTNLAIITGFAFVLLTFWRRLFYKLFATNYRQRIVIIGEGEAVTHLIEDISHNPHIGTIITVYSTLPETGLPSTDLVIAKNLSVEDILELQKNGIQTLSLESAYEELFAKIPLSLMNSDRAVALLTRDHNSASYLLGRILEIIIASIVLIVASPFLVLSSIAIYIEDRGPLFYRQTRTGKNGIPFNILKLRSMNIDAEKGGAQWAIKNDPRTTRVGKLLRKTHIDEVPQMWNIIRGDIALVGPRPERPEIVEGLEKEIPFYALRHSIRPGFTGWAQIKFRYARTVLDSKEKLEYDLYYIAHKNPLFDLGIILKTVQIIFTH